MARQCEGVVQELRHGKRHRSAQEFPPLKDPIEGTRIWTHKNGAKHTDGARQELDFIFISEDLRRNVIEISGGVHDFPDAWEMSDHAPVVVTLDF